MPLFDQEATQYDAFFDTPLGRFVDQVEKQALFEHFKINQNQTILEVGAGTGTLTRELAKQGAKIDAYDISKPMLDKARNNLGNLANFVTFHTADVHEVNVGTNQYDAAVSMATFEFLRDPKHVLTAMLDAVKPGGKVFIGTINKNGAWAELYKSEAFKDTVFASATFLDEHSLKALAPGACQSVHHTLFTPPDASTEALTLTQENKLKQQNKEGGFLWAIFQKVQK